MKRYKLKAYKDTVIRLATRTALASALATGFVMPAQATEQVTNTNDRQTPIIAGSPERMQELRELIDSRLNEIGFIYFYENYPTLAEAMIEEGYTNMATEYPELASYKKAVNMLAGGINSEIDGSTNLVGQGFINKFLRENTLDAINADGNNGLARLSQGLEAYTQNEIQQIENRIADEEQRIIEEEQRIAEEEQRIAEEQQKQAEEQQKQAEEQQRIAEEQQKQAEEQQKQAEEQQKIALLDDIQKSLDRLSE